MTWEDSLVITFCGAIDFVKWGLSLSETDSSVSMAKTWESYSLVRQVIYVDDLLAVSNCHANQRLPNIGFTSTTEEGLLTISAASW